MTTSANAKKVKPGDGPGDRRKAWKLRKQQRDGKKLSKEQETWLVEYSTNTAGHAPNAGVHGSSSPAQPTGAEQPTAESENGTSNSPAPETAAEPATAASSGPASTTPPEPFATPVPPPQPTPRIGLPPPPPPPRVRASTEQDDPRAKGASGGGSDWRAKYSGGVGAGREQTCLLLAGHWVGMLESMAGAIKLAGQDPVIDPRALHAPIVLALDEVLPDNVVMTPKIAALLGTTAIMTQRFMLRAAIKEAVEREEWKARGNAKPNAAGVDAPAPAKAPDPKETLPVEPVAPSPAIVVEDLEQLDMDFERERPIL